MRLRDLAELTLLILAEAAWITVLASLVQEYALRPVIIGIPALALFVAAGTVAGAVIGRPLGRSWPPVALALAAAAGLVGCLVSAEARIALAAGDVGRILAANPGGWLASLAVFRGYAHANDLVSGDTPESLLYLGVPGIAAAAILGGAVADPWRATFLSEAFVAASIFGLAAALGLALRRLNLVGRDAGVDWGPAPASAALLTVALVSIIVATGQMAGVIGGGIQIAVATAIGPLLVIGLILGWNRARLRLTLILALMIAFIVVAVLIFDLVPFVHVTVPGGGADEPSDPAVVTRLLSFGIGTLVIAGAVVVVLLLLQRWMRSFARPEEPAVLETRWVDLDVRARPTVGLPWRRRGRPRDAADAYAALVVDLDPREEVRREPSETPLEHAARLRLQRRGALSLDLLAADYVLARFKQVSLTDRENERGLDRWRHLRRRLGRDEPA